MHTCYSLCTNEVLNLGFSNHNHLTRLLHSIAHKRCFSAEQMSKRELKWMSRGCIYNPLTQSQPLCANSAFFVVTGRVGRWQQSTVVSNMLSDRTRRRVRSGWPDTSGHSKPSLETLSSIFTVDWTHRSRVRSVAHRVRSLTLAVLTADSATYASGQELTSVRSVKQLLLPSNTLIGCVRSRKGPRPVK
jgi:hypothetical protein